MKDMEIERKYLIRRLPEDLSSYPHRHLEQGYLNVNPVVRVRKSDDTYELTYKSGGMMARREYNLPLTEEGYAHLLSKADGHIVAKTRYFLPLGDLTIELDVFEGEFAPLMLAEVEFESVEQAESFIPPDWFGEDVTFDVRYHNSYLSQHGASI